MWHLDELNREMEQSERRPNPVAQRVKVIMALGLAVVHIHSQFFSSMTGLSFGFSTSEGTEGSLVERPAEGVADDVIEKVPLNDYLWWKVFNMSVDQVRRASRLVPMCFSTILLEYVSGENPFRKFDSLRSNYCVLARIMCHTSTSLGFAILLLRSD